ncbi:hypothetical protein WHL50_07205 [Staphylococcus aureus]|uniref:Uncharacterized protein n=2 Tax=Staphylococcus aureus TaxID=1280 RepID=A0A0E1X6Z1_STAAU|nr:hypothetical protein [Staphylococcus aureus]EFB44202.1 hypothetical protein SARG_01379 [Staphylococcus aureus subsp. aureus C101]EFG57511.1 hypothetical protein SIAG_00037 [Staphylococcus aureus subsp. aureus EMRSA16]EFH95132.1 hypothetical protein HMPREF0769_12753 [Staphylococcus aureus subsp. aureus MN8]EFU24087.1 hypothetical protein CGSSa00_09809 [Staphylococcus aureus subsp. aureus CGS00]CAG40005.1 hypothetical protein SAR1000 [Staphylococcus aureus subsp. aureus MRSA252]
MRASLIDGGYLSKGGWCLWHYLTLLKGKAYCDIYCKRITFNVKFRYVYRHFHWCSSRNN